MIKKISQSHQVSPITGHQHHQKKFSEFGQLSIEGRVVLVDLAKLHLSHDLVSINSSEESTKNKSEPYSLEIQKN